MELLQREANLSVKVVSFFLVYVVIYEYCSKINVSVVLFRANRAMCAQNHLVSIE